MNSVELTIQKADMQKLLSAANPDAALLYLYLHSGNQPEQAGQALRLNESRITNALALLQQLGLWEENRRGFVAGERPTYTEKDVVQAMDTDRDFKSLFGEVQRLLGRTLNTEEMKIILLIVRYLGLPNEVISLLIHYCKMRNQQRGNPRNPSLRTIEKEAFAWAERGLETIESATAFIQAQNMRNSQIGQIMQLLQIRGRHLTPGEEKYANSWLEAGFDMDAIALAYERTCLNTGNMNWTYMNKILTRWQEAGLLTAEQIKTGDRKQNNYDLKASGTLGEAEKENIRRILQGV